MERSCRMIGRNQVGPLVISWVQKMSMGSEDNWSQIVEGDEITELIAADTRAIETLVTRIVRLSHAGNMKKFEDVLHPLTHLNPTNLIEGMKTCTSGVLPSSITIYPNHAVFLNAGVWIPTVLGFGGLRNDALFGPIVWTAPETRFDWRLAAYTFGG